MSSEGIKDVHACFNQSLNPQAIRRAREGKKIGRKTVKILAKS